MTNIDLSQLVTAEDKTAQALAERARAVRAECAMRIFAVADQAAQMNLASAAAVGLLDADQIATYKAGLSWVAAMRTACGAAIADPDLDHTADAAWPAVPAGVAELARAF